jgi:hypothetical protein
MRLGKVAPALLACLSVGVSMAQQAQPRAQSSTEVLRSIQQSSGDIEQLRAGLHSPDASVRVSTFTAMINSNNPSLVALAINEGHVSSDAALQDLAARAAFRELTGFLVEPSGEISPDTQSAFATFSTENGLRGKVEKYDWGSGTFTLLFGQGQISGSRLSFRTNFCQGSLAVVAGSWTYEGLVVCAKLDQTKLTGKMHVSIR